MGACVTVPQPNPGKLETWWVGPVKVQKRTGYYSYQVSLRRGELDEYWDVHWDFMKRYNHDYMMYTALPLYYHKSQTQSTLIDGD